MNFLLPRLALVGFVIAFASVAAFPTPLTAQEPAAAPKEPVSYIELEDYRLYMGKDSNSYAVYSAVTKRWSSYTFPKHLNVKPWSDGTPAGFPQGWGKETGSLLSSGPVVAFEMSDAPIEELVAVDTKGRFCTHKLANPIKRPFKPFQVGGGIFYCIVEGKIYAFSGVTGTWDVLEAPEIPEPKWKDGTGTQPPLESGFDASDRGRIVVKLPFGKMIFSADQGRWKLERKPAAEEVSVPAVK
jgi:hypothetical protein